MRPHVPVLGCIALLCACSAALSADVEGGEMRDCMDKQQASNTTQMTREQMAKACKDRLQSMKAAAPSGMSKSAVKHAKTRAEPVQPEPRAK